MKEEWAGDRLSRGDLSHLMKLATRCLFVESREELASFISELYEVVPYKKAVLCKVSPPSGATAIGDFINHSYGPQWEVVYKQERFERVDPILCQCTQASGAFVWHDVVKSAMTPASVTFLEAARDFGLVNGASFVCGKATTRDPRILLSLAGVGSGTRNPMRILSALSVLGPHLQEAYKRVLERRQDVETTVKLSLRELEVLSWKRDGKTGWEISCILGISQRTVKYHLSRIAAKLNAVSASHAVAKALSLGLIE